MCHSAGGTVSVGGNACSSLLLHKVRHTGVCTWTKALGSIPRLNIERHNLHVLALFVCLFVLFLCIENIHSLFKYFLR